MDFGLLLGLAYERFVVELHAHLDAEGFPELVATTSYGYVLRTLDTGELTTTRLAERLHITPQGAAKIVEEMVAAQLVERRPDASDRRAKALWLTPRGRQALTEVRRFHALFEQQLADELGAAKVKAVRQTLTHVAERSAETDLASLFRPS